MTFGNERGGGGGSVGMKCQSNKKELLMKFREPYNFIYKMYLFWHQSFFMFQLLFWNWDADNIVNKMTPSPRIVPRIFPGIDTNSILNKLFIDWNMLDKYQIYDVWFILDRLMTNAMRIVGHLISYEKCWWFNILWEIFFNFVDIM